MVRHAPRINHEHSLTNTMEEPTPPPRWYNKPILPNWLPGWLAAGLIGGIVAALAFLFVARQFNILGLLITFAVGFGAVLLILSLTFLKSPPKEPSDFYPPPAVRFPILVAVAVGMASTWIDDQTIRGPRGFGVLAQGPFAVVIGVLLMVLAGIACYFLYARPARTTSMLVASLIGWALVIAGLTFAVRRIVQIYF